MRPRYSDIHFTAEKVPSKKKILEKTPFPAIIAAMTTHDHISTSQYRTIQQRFLHYVKSYAAPPAHRENIVLKIKHSIRVEKEMEALSIGIGQRNGQLRLAKVIGLLHDIGRFEQFKRYQTFSDKDSVDHGRFGVQVLQETDMIADIDADTRKIIEHAISNHNQARVSESLNNTAHCYAKLIRDADKLDIFRITCPRNGKRQRSFLAGIRDTVTPSNEISEAVADAIFHQKIVDMNNVNSYFDLVLLRMSWVFDMNYPKTLEQFHHKGYLGAMHGVLPQTDLADILHDIIQKYIDKQLEN